MLMYIICYVQGIKILKRKHLRMCAVLSTLMTEAR